MTRVNIVPSMGSQYQFNTTIEMSAVPRQGDGIIIKADGVDIWGEVVKVVWEPGNPNYEVQLRL